MLLNILILAVYYHDSLYSVYTGHEMSEEGVIHFLDEIEKNKPEHLQALIVLCIYFYFMFI